MESSTIISEREAAAFVKYLNKELSVVRGLEKHLPIPETISGVVESLKDAIILCKLVNVCSPGTIPESKIQYNLDKDEKSKNFRALENASVCLEGSKKLGVNIVTTQASDICQGNIRLVFGLLWQLIKKSLLSSVNIGDHPELLEHLGGGEDVATLAGEELLLRWFNFHLEQSGAFEQIENFGASVRDSVLYMNLLNRLAPGSVNEDDFWRCGENVDDETAALLRAEMILEAADKIGCRAFVTAKDIVEGNEKLNLAFVANLFNKNTGMENFTDEIHALKDRLGETMAELDDCKRTLTVANKKISDLQSNQKEMEKISQDQIRELKASKGSLEDELQETKNSVKRMGEKLFQVAGEKKELSERLDMLLSEMSETNQKSDFQQSIMSEKTQRLIDELSQEREEKASLQQQLKGTLGDLEKAKFKISQFDILINNLMKERARAEEHIVRLKKFYNSQINDESLAKILYTCLLPGYLESNFRPAFKGCVWVHKLKGKWRYKQRYVIVLDNFVFTYRLDSKGRRTDELYSIRRLDDASFKHLSQNELPVSSPFPNSIAICIDSFPDYYNVNNGHNSMSYQSGAPSSTLERHFIALSDKEDVMSDFRDSLISACSFWAKRNPIERTHAPSSASRSASFDAKKEVTPKMNVVERQEETEVIQHEVTTVTTTTIEVLQVIGEASEVDRIVKNVANAIEGVKEVVPKVTEQSVPENISDLVPQAISDLVPQSIVEAVPGVIEKITEMTEKEEDKSAEEPASSEENSSSLGDLVQGMAEEIVEGIIEGMEEAVDEAIAAAQESS